MWDGRFVANKKFDLSKHNEIVLKKVFIVERFNLGLLLLVLFVELGSKRFICTALSLLVLESRSIPPFLLLLMLVIHDIKQVPPIDAVKSVSEEIVFA